MRLSTAAFLAVTVSLIPACSSMTNTTSMTSSPIFQQALAESAIVRVIERSKNPQDTAKRVLELATATDASWTSLPTSTPLVSFIQTSLGYDTLPVSEQILVDAAITSFTADLERAADSEKLAVIERWRSVAASAAKRYLEASS